MAETALIVEVPTAEPLVAPWRRSHDPVASRGVPPHITALYPFVPPSQLDKSILGSLASLVSTLQPFAYDLVAIDQFPGVLWLRPEPDEPFRLLTGRLCDAFPDYAPYRGGHPDPQPHLTVAQVEQANQQQALRQEMASALAGHLPLRCCAEALSVFVSNDDGDWHRETVLDFGI